MAKKWMLSGFLVLVLGIGFVAANQVYGQKAASEYVYEVVVVDIPAPSAITDNRSGQERLANEMTALLNANAAKGWEPSHMWGTGPVFMILKRSKE